MGITEQAQKTETKTVRLPYAPRNTAVNRAGSAGVPRSATLAPGPKTLRITACASSTRPWDSSQRGDSGVPIRIRTRTAAGTAGQASSQRQPSGPSFSSRSPSR